ncbi:hypothetical protein [Tistlia consotensis]|uniref:hypothetical protein n=1 Tax=Tistlia consotensis TaxID=1321365 RepID=UPI000A14C8B1|nr:hypothetical protein [Tistlia consotensis]
MATWLRAKRARSARARVRGAVPSTALASERSVALCMGAALLLAALLPAAGAAIAGEGPPLEPGERAGAASTGTSASLPDLPAWSPFRSRGWEGDWVGLAERISGGAACARQASLRLAATGRELSASLELDDGGRQTWQGRVASDGSFEAWVTDPAVSASGAPTFAISGRLRASDGEGRYAATGIEGPPCVRRLSFWRAAETVEGAGPVQPR